MFFFFFCRLHDALFMENNYGTGWKWHLFYFVQAGIIPGGLGM